MVLKSFALCVLALLTCSSCCLCRQDATNSSAPGQVVDERQFVTHGELAQRIVWMMGDEAKLPARATALDYQNYLSRKGISPLHGWRSDEPVTKGDLAVVTVRFLKLQDRVADPTDETTYIALLESIELRTVIE